MNIFKGIGLVGTRAVGSFLQFALSVSIAHFYGTSITGVFFTYLSWGQFFSIAFGLGLSTRGMQVIAKFRGTSQEEKAWNYISRAIRGNFAISGVISIFLICLFPVFKNILPTDLSLIFNFAILTGFGLTNLRIVCDSLKGMGRANLSMLLEFVFPQTTLLFFIIYTNFFDPQVPNEKFLLTFYTVAILSISIILVFLLYSRVNEYQKRWVISSRKEFVKWNEITNSAPLWSVAILNNLLYALPYIVLPFFLDYVSIGIFAICHRLLGLLSTFSLALSSYYLPVFAQLGLRQDYDQLKVRFQESRKFLILICTPALGLFLLLPSKVLYIFGQSFQVDVAVQMLIILSLFKICTLFSGLSEGVLTMIGDGYSEVLSQVFGIIVFAVLIIILSPTMKITGAAYALGASWSCRSLVSWVLLKKRIFLKIAVKESYII